MSVIKKKPFVEKVIESLSDAQKTTLGTQINASGNAIVNKTISQVEDGIHTYLLKLNEFLVVPAICIKTDDYEVALGYGNKQIINIYNLDTEVGSYTEIKEHCSIEELRRIVFGGGGGGGGEVTPEQLDELIDSGDDEINVDLSEDESKLLISLHAKKVTITAPSTATSGTITSAQLAALKESTFSYIYWNNEKYYLNDDGHVTGSLGYSHVGVENGVYMIKNITITESTLSWVLTTKDLVDEKVFLINGSCEYIDPFFEAPITFTGDNPFDEIVDYINEKGRIPLVILNLTIKLGTTPLISNSLFLNQVSYDLTTTTPYINLASSSLSISSVSSASSTDVTVILKSSVMEGRVSQADLTGEEEQFHITLVPTAPDLSAISVTSPNYFNGIKNYFTTKGRYPTIYGDMATGTGQTTAMKVVDVIIESSRIIVRANMVQTEVGSKLSVYDLRVIMDSSGLQTDQSAYVNIIYVGNPLIITKAFNMTMEGGTYRVPQLSATELSKIVDQMKAAGAQIVLNSSSASTGDPKVMIPLETDGTNVTFSYSKGMLIKYINNGAVVYPTIIRTSETIQVHQASDLPTSSVTDGFVHIVICDNGLLPDPTDQKAGYIYFEKEA